MVNGIDFGVSVDNNSYRIYYLGHRSFRLLADMNMIEAAFDIWIKKYCGEYVEPESADYTYANMKSAFFEAAKIFGGVANESN